MSEAPLRSDAVPRAPIPGLPETQDQLYGMVVALAGQLAVTRERLDTVERLAEKAGLFRSEDIEAFVPDAAAARDRDTIRQGLIARVFRPVQDAAARTARLLKGEQP